MGSCPRPIELLAPARNADIAIEAIRHGADAVYIGASSHGARSAATNSVADIARIIETAHCFRARVYVTLNTIIYDHELAQVETLIHELYRADVDALIVQDMALLRLDIPPIALHASTQCDIRTPDKARFLADVGFEQLVLPREMTLREMQAIHEAVPETTLEAFCHGALCVSYSGDCQAGMATQRRSANRGECPQICRHKFDLIDSSGTRLIEGRHLLSLRDLNRSPHIPDMLQAGISSFKIEGRLKDAAYVKNTVAAYRKAIDRAIELQPDLYVRASQGAVTTSFTPSLCESFNRGFTSYFTTSPRPDEKMASFLTPKWVGTEVGRVTACSPRGIEARLNTKIANGDGLGYFDRSGKFCGFRVNRAADNTLYPASPQHIIPGTVLYRNHNKAREDALAGNTSSRCIPVDLTLRTTPSGIAIDASTTFGPAVTATLESPTEKALKPQTDTHLKILSKMGDTIFTPGSITVLAEQTFIPASQLTALRRESLELLTANILTTHPLHRRPPENRDATFPDTALSYHHNVANHLAHAFYLSHGVTSIERALETTVDSTPAEPRRERTVMTTRYCLRRECDRCLRTPQGEKWPAELYLASGPDRFRLSFDCSQCLMHLSTTP